MSVISSGTTLTTALVQTGDTNGNLVFKTGASGTTALTLGADQSATFAGAVSFSGGAFAAGSAGAPSITFTGDTNTGIFSPAADTIAFTEGGVESMRIDSSGNLGIGTSSPDSKLAVYNATGTTQLRFGASSNYYWDISRDNDTTGNLWFSNYNASGSRTNRMVIDSSGNVGIGTSSPSAKLDVNKGSAGVLANFTDGVNTNCQISTTSLVATVGPTAGSTALAFQSSGTERMRIDSSGNVGIGTSSPTERLVIVNTSSTAEMQLRGGTTAANYSQIGLYGGSTRNAEVSSNSAFLTLDHQNSGVINFRTGGSERMRLDAAGNLLVGTTSAFYPSARATFRKDQANVTFVVENEVGSSSQTYRSKMAAGANDTNSFHFVGTSGTTDRVYIYGNGNIVNSNNSYGTLSDVKLKENIVDATPKLLDVMRLQVRNFNLKSEPDQKQIGFVAQELEQVFPAMIDESPDLDEEGNELDTVTKSIKTSVLVPILVKAIQEQQAIITEQASTIAAFEARLTALENK